MPSEGRLVLAGKVASVKPSKIPRISVAVIEGRGFNVTMDIHDELRTFSVGDAVKVIISKTMPEFREGEDFCARGFIMSKKPGGKNRVKLLVSLWGFLASVEIPKKNDVFKIMDEIYYCVSKA